MDSVGIFWAWVWGLAAIVAVVGISCVTYYNQQTLLFPLRLIEKGYNPAIIKCLKVNWEYIGNNTICKMVFSQENLTIDDVGELLKKLNDE